MRISVPVAMEHRMHEPGRRNEQSSATPVEGGREPHTDMSRRRALRLTAGMVGGAVLARATPEVLTQQTTGTPASPPAALAPVAPVDASVIPGLASEALSGRSP